MPKIQLSLFDEDLEPQSTERWQVTDFSADLVKRLLKEFDLKEGDTVLDPFVGSGTTFLVCKMQKINSIGFDVLPMSKIAIEAKQSVFEYDLSEIKQLISEIENLSLPEIYDKRTKYVTITDGAYPDTTEKQIGFKPLKVYSLLHLSTASQEVF